MLGELESAPTLQSLREKRAAIFEAVHRHHARGYVGVFGSVARGEADSNSDVDILVEFEPDASLIDLAALEISLKELLGVSVDVMSFHSCGRAADHARAHAVPL